MGKTREQSQSIDPRLTDAAVRNIERAEKAQQIPFMPNHGLRVAALSPAEMASRAMSNQAASAFGFDPAGFGLPKPETVDGLRGYRTSGLYDDAVQNSVPSEFQDYINSFFIDPSGAATQPQPTPEVPNAPYTVNGQVMDYRIDERGNIVGQNANEGGYGTTHSGAGAPSVSIGGGLAGAAADAVGFDPFGW